jgi:hypothetical protein
VVQVAVKVFWEQVEYAAVRYLVPAENFNAIMLRAQAADAIGANPLAGTLKRLQLYQDKYIV